LKTTKDISLPCLVRENKEIISPNMGYKNRS